MFDWWVGKSGKFGVMVLKASMLNWGAKSASTFAKFHVAVFKASASRSAKFGAAVFKASMLNWMG